jgi:hypothetical protein
MNEPLIVKLTQELIARARKAAQKRGFVLEDFVNEVLRESNHAAAPANETPERSK